MSKDDKQISKIGQQIKQVQNQENIKVFIRSFEIKKQSILGLFELYAKHAFNKHFQSTFKAAVALLVLPSLTNIYYAVRSQSMFSKTMPIVVPISALLNYVYFFNKDMKNFSLTNQQDSQLARSHFQIIYEYSFFDRSNAQHQEKLLNFIQDKKREKKQLVLK